MKFHLTKITFIVNLGEAIKPKRASSKVSDISASQLIKQRNLLKPTNAPHPQQLSDLSRVEEQQLLDLAHILKKVDQCFFKIWDIMN